MIFELPLLMADIGGTNARFSMVCERGQSLSPMWQEPTRTSSDLADISENYLQKSDACGAMRPRSMIVCAAGPLHGRSVQLTNIDMKINGQRLAERLVLEQGLLLNDFEAQAIALPQLRENMLRHIGPRRFDARTLEPCLILGPGTGLGAATLVAIKSAGRTLRLALPSEAGHMNLAPSSKLERAILAAALPNEDRTLAEFILSGSGLSRVASAWRLVHGLESKLRKPECVVADALKFPASPEADAIRLYWQLIGGFAGDLALAHMATGGVILAGGVLPRLLPFLIDESFRQAFAPDNAMREFLNAIPVGLITEPDVVFSGMADLAADPQSYAIDYTERLWVARSAF